MHRGYIKIWRKLEDSGLFQMPNTFTLFMYILVNASHKDKKVGTTTGAIDLKRGQFIAGRSLLSKKLKISEQKTRTSLDRLVYLDILTIKSTNKYSIYTIVNYDIYQDDNQQTTSRITNNQPADNQQITTKQEVKKEKNTTYVPPIPAELLSDFLKVRKAKHAGDLTLTAFKGIEIEARKAGVTTIKAIEICCLRGWAGFKADWIPQESNPFAGAI